MFPQYGAPQYGGSFARPAPAVGFGGASYPAQYAGAAIRPAVGVQQPLIRSSVGVQQPLMRPAVGGYGAPVYGAGYGQQIHGGARVVHQGMQGAYGAPVYQQRAYQVKPATDPKLQKLKDVRASCQLGQIAVEQALLTFKGACADGQLSKANFTTAFTELLTANGVSIPSQAIQDATFELFDRDGNGTVDMMELCCALSLLCKGDEDEKIAAVFKAFDENGDGFISKDEMSTFLRSVFRVVLTPAVKGVMAAQGVRVDSPEELADATMEECFKQADVNEDGKLTIGEFRKWFYASGADPSVVFSPLKNILH